MLLSYESSSSESIIGEEPSTGAGVQESNKVGKVKDSGYVTTPWSSTVSHEGGQSNIMKGSSDEPIVTTESVIHRSKLIKMITESSTRHLVPEDEIKKEEESWEDFGWNSEEEEELGLTTTNKPSTESDPISIRVTVPPSLLEDAGGDWGDDFEEEWDEGWD